MPRAQIKASAGVLAGTLFCVVVAEMGVLASAGPTAFSTRAYLLTTPLFLLLPTATMIYCWLDWGSARGEVSLGSRRFKRAMCLVGLAGGVLYAALVGPSWLDVPMATFHLLYAQLGHPVWAVLSLVVLTSAAFVFAVQLMALLHRTMGARSLVATAVAWTAGLALWIVALNGLAVFVTGAALLGS